MKVDVVLPTYNSMPFLKEAVDSILRQTYSNLRLLIIDNGSTDNTASYCQSLMDKRVFFFRLEEPSLVEALNFGIQRCTSEYIARMDSDDISHPQRIEKQLNFLVNNKNIDIVGVSGRYIGEKNKSSLPFSMPTPHWMIKKKMINAQHSMVHGSILFRNEMTRNFYYTPEAFPCEDYELFLRLIDKYSFANLRDELYFFRIKKDSIQSLRAIENYKKFLGFTIAYKKKKLLVKEFFFNKAILTIKGSIVAHSLFFYRKGLICFLNDRKISGVFFFFISSVFSPARAVLKIFDFFIYKKYYSNKI